MTAAAGPELGSHGSRCGRNNQPKPAQRFHRTAVADRRCWLFGHQACNLCPTKAMGAQQQQGNGYWLAVIGYWLLLFAWLGCKLAGQPARAASSQSNQLLQELKRRPKIHTPLLLVYEQLAGAGGAVGGSKISLQRTTTSAK